MKCIVLFLSSQPFIIPLVIPRKNLMSKLKYIVTFLIFTQPLLWKGFSSMDSLVFAFHRICERVSPVWIQKFHIDFFTCMHQGTSQKISQSFIIPLVLLRKNLTGFNLHYLGLLTGPTAILMIIYACFWQIWCQKWSTLYHF